MKISSLTNKINSTHFKQQNNSKKRINTLFYSNAEKQDKNKHLPTTIKNFFYSLKLKQLGISDENSDLIFNPKINNTQRKILFKLLKEDKNTNKTYKRISINTDKNTSSTTLIYEKTSLNQNGLTYIRKIIDHNGNIKTERTELDKNGIFNSRYKNSNRSYITSMTLKPKGNLLESSKINSQFEIIKNALGEPVQIIYTQPDPNLNGAYKRTLYNFKDYPEDLDIIGMIKKNELKGGINISGSKINKDGSIEYIENLNNNGISTKRHYIEYKDQEGNTIKYQYAYQIFDENNNCIMNHQISFKKTGNRTISIINGKKYIAFFDDNNQTITLTSDEFERKIDIYSKTQGDIRLFEICKNLIATSLIDIDENVDIWHYSTDENTSYNIKTKTLESSADIGLINHELGHSKDFKMILGNPDEIENKKVLSNNDEFLQISTEEYNAFCNKNTTETTALVLNFSPYYKKGNFELFAEINALLNSYEIKNNNSSTRAQLLIEHFPKTIAFAKKLLFK